jgi:hypothetical protein
MIAVRRHLCAFVGAGAVLAIGAGTTMCGEKTPGECRGAHFPKGTYAEAMLACAPSVANDVTRVAAPTKIFQLLGDLDREPSPPVATRDRTATAFGLLGADEGYPVLHDGKLLFFFADALAADPDDPLRPRDADVVGWTSDTTGSGADTGFDLSFFLDTDERYAAMRVDGHFLCRNDSASAAFSNGSTLYGLFHRGAFDGETDPRTGQKDEYGFLATSDDDGRSFRLAFELPSSELVDTQSAIVATSSLAGAPWSDGETVLVFGRRLHAAPIVAAAPLARVTDASTWVFWNGTGFSASDADATRIFCDPDDGQVCEGNFSISFLADADRWLLVERCRPKSDPDGTGSFLGYRVARNPLGPWSERMLFLSARDEGGYCGFVHECCGGDASCARACCDTNVTPVYDSTEPFDGPTVNGFLYAPYVIAPWTRWDPTMRVATIYSFVSTGNPYTPQLLRTKLHVP